MSTPRPSQFVTARIVRRNGSTTDLVKEAVSAALEQQRAGIDGVRGLRAVAIKVHLPPLAAVTRSVVINFETET